jgi:hypothetical protein
VFAYVAPRKYSGGVMYSTSRMLRVLMVRNLLAFRKIIRRRRVFDVEAYKRFGATDKIARDILSVCGLGDDTMIGFMKRVELVHLVDLKDFFCSKLPSLTHPVLVMIRHKSMTTAFYLEGSFPLLENLFEPEEDKEKQIFFQLAPHVQFMQISRI